MRPWIAISITTTAVAFDFDNLLFEHVVIWEKLYMIQSLAYVNPFVKLAYASHINFFQ